MSIDHVVYGVDDLDAGVEDLARRLGVRPAPGGRHVGRGTHNALLGLGGGAYLEVIAIDPGQPPSGEPVAFALDRMRLPRLVGWAWRTADLDRQAAAALVRGFDPGQVRSMSRLRADGTLLEWRLTRRAAEPDRLVVPFLIDWGDAPHPSDSAPAGVRLVELRAEHPDAETVRAELEALGAALAVDTGPEPALSAALDTPLGRVVLR
jgi:hypothetical protein